MRPWTPRCLGSRNRFNEKGGSKSAAVVTSCLHSSAEDTPWVEKLWEAGLTVTIQVRICGSEKDRALARNIQSEAVKALGHGALSDSFLAFASTVRTLRIEKVKDGDDLGLRFNGTIYSAAIHKAATALSALLTNPPGRLQQALQKLELEFGRETLSNEYSKLSKLISIAKGAQTGGESVSETAGWLVEMLHLGFRLRLRSPAKATQEWLEKERKSGNMGFWPACLVILQAPGSVTLPDL